MNRQMIEDEIVRRGIKRGWLAEQLEIHPTTLRRFLSGKTMLAGEKLLKLLEILKLNPETLKKKAS